MTTTQLLLIIVFFWALVGATTSIVMGRRGHSSVTWLLVAIFLGPLAIPPR